MESLNLDAWKAALEQIRANDSGDLWGVSTKELAAEWGCSHSQASARINKLTEAGVEIEARRVPYINARGQQVHHWRYKLREESVQ